MTTEIQVSDKLSDALRKLIAEKGIQHTTVSSRFTDIITRQYLILVRDVDDVALLARAKGKACDKRKLFMLIGVYDHTSPIKPDVMGKFVRVTRDAGYVLVVTKRAFPSFLVSIIRHEMSSPRITIGEAAGMPSTFVEHVGVTMNIARILAKHYDSVDDLRGKTKKDLTAIKGIGDKTAEFIVKAIA